MFKTNFLIVLLTICRSSGSKYNPEEYLDAAQIIALHGYSSETHIVVTDEGYLLKLHRIPGSKNGVKGEPIFLQHGLLGSSADWLINGNQSLGFLLADKGYDVWLGNARGNTYSKGHLTLSTSSPNFWNYSWHEMGTKDLPACFSYVQKITGEDQLTYIGHSMGTTMFFALSSVYPEKVVNIKLMIGLAPVAYMTNVKSPIRYLAPFSQDVEWLVKYLGLNQFLPNDKLLKFLAYECELLDIEKEICENVIFLLCGYDKEGLNQDILPVIFRQEPAGTSTQTVIHYAQEIKYQGSFQQFDYGTKQNLIRYGKPTPPKYSTSNIKQPIYMMYAQNDWLATYLDVRKLSKEISNLQGLYKIPVDTFNHVDFLFGKDVKKLVYDPLIRFLRNYTRYS